MSAIDAPAQSFLNKLGKAIKNEVENRVTKEVEKEVKKVHKSNRQPIKANHSTMRMKDT